MASTPPASAPIWTRCASGSVEPWTGAVRPILRLSMGAREHEHAASVLRFSRPHQPRDVLAAGRSLDRLRPDRHDLRAVGGANRQYQTRLHCPERPDRRGGDRNCVSGLAIGAKRLHDRDRSGWWILLFYAVPAALWIIAGKMNNDLAETILNVIG